MTELAAAIIFLCLTLLAIVVAIFVLSASLLGRAVAEMRKEQQETAERESKEAKKQAEQLGEIIEAVEANLKKAEASEVINDLDQELRQYKKQMKESKKKLKRIRRRYRRYWLLTAPRGVLPTSILILVSFSLAAVTQLFTTVVGYATLGVSILALVLACVRIYGSLCAVQEVAVGTEEAQFKRETEALETALEKHEEKKRVNLQLVFTDPKPPFKFKPSCKQIVKYKVFLTQGDVAKASEIWFMVPKTFKLPGVKTYIGSGYDESSPDMLKSIIEMGDMKRGLEYSRNITIELPPETGIYILSYYLNCEGYPGRFVKFEVEVAA